MNSLQTNNSLNENVLVYLVIYFQELLEAVIRSKWDYFRVIYLYINAFTIKRVLLLYI